MIRSNSIPFLSVIIPFYNEEKRLYKTKKLFNYLDEQNFICETVFVNDGSTDNSLNKIKKTLSGRNHKIISYKTNQGKGFAIRTGMLHANGLYRLFTDIDLSTPIEEFSKFLPHLASYDVVIGTRKNKKSRIVKRQPKLRENLGKVFTLTSQKVLNLSITDFTCGFKCFSQKAAKTIFSRQKIKRWGFDSEILFLAQKHGYKIKEIPIKWSNDSLTKVKMPHDIFTSLSDLAKIHLNNLSGKYK